MTRVWNWTAVALATVATMSAGANAATQDSCTAAKLGTAVPVASIGEPVSAVTLRAPVWTAGAAGSTSYCSIDGVIAPVYTSPNAKPINFRVVLPAAWAMHAAQLGGGGMNGTIPNLTAGPDPLIGKGFATYGSDSGHQSAGGGPGAPGSGDWSTNDEAIKNLGYMQMKKTHDAAMVVIERMYGAKPRFNYYIGTSQGGREALTVAQRYPADYDGIAANVPIVNFSSLMLGPELIRIHEKKIANWVTRAKVNAIRGEFMRQCDGLDGLVDGVSNNYMACRAIFDVTQPPAGRTPWASKRCPNNVDPNPAETSASACLTDGQISTLQVTYSPYTFATPLVNGVKSFGMGVPTTDPSGSGLIVDARFQGQEGADASAAKHSHLGILGVTGFLMKDTSANPLDYVEGGSLNARRLEISKWLDATDPDLSKFAARGGKMIVAIGTNDTLASPGAQLAYYKSLIDTMSRTRVDQFARLFVMPQVGHGLSGTNYSTDGEGKTIAMTPIPNTYDRLGSLFDWAEKGVAPAKTLTVTAGDKSLPLCSYPSYPKYTSGPTTAATSYVCSS